MFTYVVSLTSSKKKSVLANDGFLGKLAPERPPLDINTNPTPDEDIGVASIAGIVLLDTVELARLLKASCSIVSSVMP